MTDEGDAGAALSSLDVRTALELSDINVAFAGNRVLADVRIAIRPGEVRGLVGANGAGKSSLVKVLAGIYKPGPGANLRVDGRTLDLPMAPSVAERAGLTFVHQKLGLIPSLPVVENLFLGHGYETPANGLRRIRWKQERDRASRLLESVGLAVDPAAQLGSFDRQQMVLVALARALRHRQPKVLVLDEPTAHLRFAEAERIHKAVRQASEAGVGVLFISHRLHEIFELCDQVTVLRDGRVVWEGASEETDDNELVRAMTRSANAAPRTVTTTRHNLPRQDHQPSTVPALVARNLAGGSCEDVSLEVGTGEVLGITGVSGSGIEDVGRLLYGDIARRAGSVERGQLPVAGGVRNALDAGVGFLPGERAELGSFPALRALDNMTIGVLPRLRRRHGLSDTVLRAHSREHMHSEDVRPHNPDLEFALLSGGNQQKALLSRWLVTEPQVLIIEEPTQGVDSDAKARIYARIRSEAAAGRSFVIISSDEDELALLADRVAVMNGGCVVELLERCQAHEIVAASQGRANDSKDGEG